MQAWWKNLWAVDVSARVQTVVEDTDASPECLGLPIACWYIALMMLFIPFPFSHIFGAQESTVGREAFPQAEVGCVSMASQAEHSN